MWFSVVHVLLVTCLFLLLEFLTNELEKSSIEPRPAGNIEAPDPQELIDLEVRKGEERGGEMICLLLLHVYHLLVVYFNLISLFLHRASLKS